MRSSCSALKREARDGPLSSGLKHIGGMKLDPDVPVKIGRKSGLASLSAYFGWSSTVPTSVLRMGEAKYVDVNIHRACCTSALQEPRFDPANL